MDQTEQNIYGQDFNERNAIVDLPDGYAENAGNTLYSWLGSLWHTIHRGDGMVRGLQKARGIRLAQLYLDLLEAAKLQDRNGAPVFHKELWHPIVLRLSQRDKAQENLLEIGNDAQIGPQTEEEPYGFGTVLKMGRLANYKNFVTYPIPENIVSVSSVIVDNIINPTVAMEHDKDDFVFRNNTIIFPKENDPLADGSPFEKTDLPDFVDGKPDVEVVLWASDVLVDKNYIAEHLSYPLGANAPSSDVVKRIVNAAWSSVASGLTPELVRTFIAAMLNIPVVQHDGETVVDIDSTQEAQIVYTDRGMYRISPKAKLRKGLHAGSVLAKGDLLDESLRVYPFLNGVSWSGEDAATARSAGDNLGSSASDTFEDVLAAVPQYYNTTPVGTPSGANQTYLFFRTQGFGMSAGQKINSMSFTTAGGASYSKLHARIWSYSGNVSNPKGELLAVSEEVVWDAGSGSAHDFVFPDGIVIPATDSYFVLDFSSSPEGDTISTFRILCYNYSPARNPDCYWGSSILVPVLTVEFSDSADESSSASSGSSGSSGGSESSDSTPGEMVISYKDTGFSIPLEQDIPSIVMPRDILRVRTRYGVYAMWGASTVKASKSDPSRLYFDIGGTEEDKAAFWNDVWSHAEEAGVSMARLIGNEGDQVSPAAFFLRHFVGANTMFVVVDDAQLEDASLLRDPMFFGMLTSVVPSAIRLFIVEHRSVADDRMNLGSAQEEIHLAAALPNVREDVVENVVPGLKISGVSFRDAVNVRFVRSAPDKVRVRKEED